MKKIFLLTIAAAISLGSIAQGNSNRAHQNHKKDKKEKKAKDRDYNDDRARNDDWRNRDSRDGDWRNRDRNDDDRRDRDSRNGDWRTGRNDNDRNNGNYDQNSGQAPRKVRDAFYRDYPNAGNVAWTKDRGIWSARFKRSGLFGGNTTASYRANGQRVDNNNYNNTVFNRRN